MKEGSHQATAERGVRESSSDRVRSSQNGAQSSLKASRVQRGIVSCSRAGATIDMRPVKL